MMDSHTIDDQWNVLKHTYLAQELLLSPEGPVITASKQPGIVLYYCCLLAYNNNNNGLLLRWWMLIHTSTRSFESQ